MSTPSKISADLIEDADRAIEHYEKWQRTADDIDRRRDLDETDDNYPTDNELEELEDDAAADYPWAMELVKALFDSATS